MAAVAPLLHRYRSLTDAASPAEVDQLAAEVAAVLPRPAGAPAPVELDAMEALLGDRPTAGQRRFMRRLRHFLIRD